MMKDSRIWISLSLAAWLVAVNVFHPVGIDDEGFHLRGIRQIASGDLSVPRHLPMSPGFHYLMAVPARLLGPEVTYLRPIVALLSLATALVVYRGLAALRGQARAATEVLHVMWMPVYFTFTVLLYTEAAATLCLTLALVATSRGRTVAAAVALLAGCLMRQSLAAWTPVLALAAALSSIPRNPEGDDLRSASRVLGRAWRQLLPFACVIAVALAIVASQGSLALNRIEVNRVEINAAQFYVFGLFTLGLWAPVWWGQIRSDLASVRAWAGRRPWPALSGMIAGAALLVFLTLSFTNPHRYNVSLGYLRNWPLRLMEVSWMARLAGIAAFGLATLLVWRWTVRQPRRLLLVATWACTVPYLALHRLVEPRYYIYTFLLLHWWAEWTDVQARRLTVWYALVSALMCIGVPLGGNW